ncbi:MAG: hypothetical protein L6V91_09690 [Bacilli bacterium]|nr:MAG: hypothetical protein L6V91_09690 [Bacilli bacterium]
MNTDLNEYNSYFGVRHYKVHVTKERIKPLRFITSVISYALFIWLFTNRTYFVTLYRRYKNKSNER